MEWGSIIVYGILIFFVLAVVARITGQTLPELIGGLSEKMFGAKDDIVDGVREL